MKKEYEITLGKFFSSCKQYYEVTDNVAIEDVRFNKFTDLLDSAGIFKNVNHCRYEGTGVNNTHWKILGYAFTNDIISDNDNDDEDNLDYREYEWNYTIFNGFFSGDNLIVNSKKTDIQKAVSEVVNFIESTFSDNSKFIIQDYHPVNEFQEHILNLKKKQLLDRVDICIITDNLIDHESLDSNIFIKSLQCEAKIHYWGINKWSDLSRSKGKRLPINLNFHTDEKMNYRVPFLELKHNDDFKYYLSIFPGDLIADLYSEYDTQLLENNVRVFLSLKSKYNRQMSKTISDSPDMFFSYNNGISATASSIKVDNGMIESISDFQIVNGGQTTATLYHTRKHLKKSLSNIHLQVKLSVLRKTDNYPALVSNISKYANSQSAVKSSDFWTNDPFLVDFEKLSLKNPIDRDGVFLYYFFERMSGQYKETRARKGTKRDIMAWEKQNPEKLSYNKISLTRWFNAMNLQPNISVSSNEKQFELFMANSNKPTLTTSLYKTVIGFGRLCERSRIVTGKASSKQFPPIIGDPNVGMATSIYAMSYFHYITQGRFDYHKIYDFRINVEELDNILKVIIVKCWDKIFEFDNINTRDSTRRSSACWNYVRDGITLDKFTLDSLQNYLISQEEFDRRGSKDISEEEFYFFSLNSLIKDDSILLLNLLDAAQLNSKYYQYRSLLKNAIERLNNKTGVITLSTIKRILDFKEDLKDFDLLTNCKTTLKVDIDPIYIYENIFKSRSQFFEQIESVIMSKSGSDFEIYVLLEKEIKELIESFDLYPGSSIGDMMRIQEILDLFKR